MEQVLPALPEEAMDISSTDTLLAAGRVISVVEGILVVQARTPPLAPLRACLTHFHRKPYLSASNQSTTLLGNCLYYRFIHSTQARELMRALDVGSVLCSESRTPYGRIEDIFGPVSRPLYALRSNVSDAIVNGATVYAPAALAVFVDTQSAWQQVLTSQIV